MVLRSTKTRNVSFGKSKENRCLNSEIPTQELGKVFATPSSASDMKSAWLLMESAVNKVVPLTF